MPYSSVENASVLNLSIRPSLPYCCRASARYFGLRRLPVSTDNRKAGGKTGETRMQVLEEPRARSSRLVPWHALIVCFAILGGLPSLGPAAGRGPGGRGDA